MTFLLSTQRIAESNTFTAYSFPSCMLLYWTFQAAKQKEFSHMSRKVDCYHIQSILPLCHSFQNQYFPSGHIDWAFYYHFRPKHDKKDKVIIVFDTEGKCSVTTRYPSLDVQRPINRINWPSTSSTSVLKHLIKKQSLKRSINSTLFQEDWLNVT
jgi:actin-related protein